MLRLALLCGPEPQHHAASQGHSQGGPVTLGQSSARIRGSLPSACNRPAQAPLPLIPRGTPFLFLEFTLCPCLPTWAHAVASMLTAHSPREDQCKDHLLHGALLALPSQNSPRTPLPFP